MTTKEIAINSLRELPETATWEDIQERINFIAAVEQGIREADEGNFVSHEQVLRNLAPWLTN